MRSAHERKSFMYQVLIVDDEQPAVRFVRSIIEQFSKGFHVAGTASGVEPALEFLSQHTVDLLITDISMHGMDGIELSKLVRKMQPNIHIVIISGYGKFEYAQGAIQAGVDEYLLKPVSITKMTAVLNEVYGKLEAENADLAASILPALACGQPYSTEAAQQLYGKENYRFALVRWGNLDVTLSPALSATSLIPPGDETFTALRGRDDSERVLIAREQGTDELLSSLSIYMTSPGSFPTWTAVYTPSFQPMEQLPAFIRRAVDALSRKTVIGRHQILKLSGSASPESIRLSGGELKQLAHFISFEKPRMLKDYLSTLAASWEKERVPQWDVFQMCRQILYQAASASPAVGARLESILPEFNQLIREAASYSALAEGLCSLLIDENRTRDQKLSTRELYDYAVKYIGENYAQPLSMQSICDEIGISQTYLSRLFRKYSDTTFNAYLTQCRMEAAMKLLRDKPDFLLRDVAACVGYEDSSYFTKVFRQYTGKTPSQWASRE